MKKLVISALMIILFGSVASCSQSDVDLLRLAKRDGRALFSAIDSGSVIHRVDGDNRLSFFDAVGDTGSDTSKGVGVYPMDGKTLQVLFLGYSSASELREMRRVLETVHFEFPKVELVAYRGEKYTKDSVNHRLLTKPFDLLLQCWKDEDQKVECSESSR